MRTWIPWEEIEAEWMKEPGYAERREQAERELDAEIAIYGTIGNPKPAPRHAAPVRSTAKRKPHGFSVRHKRVHATA